MAQDGQTERRMDMDKPKAEGEKIGACYSQHCFVHKNSPANSFFGMAQPK